MSQWNEISTKELVGNPFEMIGKQWMLVTAEHEGKANTMTASWGGLGVMWGKDVAHVVVRPQRYTKEFLDQSSSFSLSFLGEEFRKQLSYLGSVSGRDEDKITKAGLTLCHQDGVPFFEQAQTVLLCEKLYAQPMQENCFLGTEEVEKWYPQKDYHTLYIAQIKQVLTK